jgi:phage terminase large subunit-like protein
LVAETNFGGAMVGEVLRGAKAGIPFKEVRASRGKAVRAEPIAVLFEKGKVSLVGYFPELEDQLCSMSTSGYMGPRSPDRADALVWGLSELFPSLAARDHNNTSAASRRYQEAQNMAYDPFNLGARDYDPYRRDEEYSPFS